MELEYYTKQIQSDFKKLSSLIQIDDIDESSISIAIEKDSLSPEDYIDILGIIEEYIVPAKKEYHYYVTLCTEDKDVIVNTWIFNFENFRWKD